MNAGERATLAQREPQRDADPAGGLPTTGAGIEVRELTITDAWGRPVLDRVGFTAPAGGAVALLGQSGAGKTTVALALLGRIRPGLRWVAGEVMVAGRRPLALRGRRLAAYRRSHVAWLGQDPAATLTPTMTVAALVGEVLAVTRFRVGTAPWVRERVRQALVAVGLPTDNAFLRRRPHQLSGGQRRRVALARALIRRPGVLVLDEPASGLDEAARSQVTAEVMAVREAAGATLVVITHDLAVARELTGQVVVLDRGEVVEEGATGTVLSAPAAAVTARMLRAAAPVPLRPSVPAHRSAALTVEGLTAGYSTAGTPLLDRLSFTLAAGECLAVTGPSGAGKSTLVRCLVGLHPPLAGRITLATEELAPRARNRTPAQRRALGYVPQDPLTSLNPARTVAATLAGPLRSSGWHPRAGQDWPAGVPALLRAVGLDLALAPRRPQELSGGQRQRVALARALAAGPRVLVCDEITSALDADVAAEVLHLLETLRRRFGLSILLITHDRSSAGRVASRTLALPVPGAPAPPSEGERDAH